MAFRIVTPLEDQHGDTAAIHAAMRADALLDAGDLDGYAVWRRIVRAVRELLNRAEFESCSDQARPPTSAVHLSRIARAPLVVGFIASS